VKYTGRFLSSLLRSILNWYLDEAAYIQDNRTKAVGGKTICLPGMQKSFLKDSSKPVELSNLLTWPEYQKIVRKWYRKLATVRISLISFRHLCLIVNLQGFIECIQTGEFMHVYNSIVVLKEILDVFPLISVNEAGVGINAAVDRLIETEDRGDLKILARS
jgi:THO complex subunit 2